MAKNKLFLIPYAGGSAKGYLVMKRYFNNEVVELVPLELAGRGARIKEPCMEDVQTCVKVLYQKLLPQIEGCSYGIFGHSLGTIIGFELARYIERQGIKSPLCCIFSGRVAPDYPFPGPVLGNMGDKEFLEKFNALQALPDELLSNQAIRQLILPVLRADVKMSETYCYEAGEKLKSDLFVLYGMNDRIVCEEGLRSWSNMTEGKVEFTQFSGGHFYYKEQSESFAERIHEILARYGQ